jgi:hypothetical protein
VQNLIKSKVAGTTFKQFDWDALRAGLELRWEREKDNAHDANAIALYNPITHEQVGYINRHQAEKLAPWIDGDESFAMTVLVTEITGGQGPKKHRGINIEIRIGGVDTSQYFDLSEIWGSIA